MSIEISNVVGDLRLLANGPIATVCAGRPAGAGAEVAVKMFPSGFDRDTATWLDRERKALATVRSTPSILQVQRLVEHPDGRSGVQMELCPGSLAGVLGSSGTLAVPEVLAIGSAVATALAAAHQVGVLHGGVTPHNVLYRASGECVLADFGLALRRQFPRDPMYAVEYSAPETLRDDTLSVASDLYGLGAVLYTALTGAPPFPRSLGQQPAERILQVLRGEVAPVRGPGIPARLSDGIAHLLAKDPARRPQDAGAVAELFDNLRGGAHAEPVVAAEDQDELETGFDDFADVASPAPPLRPAEPVRPPTPAGRTLVRTFDGTATPVRRRRQSGLLVGAGVVVVAGLAVVPMLAGPREVTGHASPVAAAQPAPSAAPAPDIRLALSPPADLVDHVRLTWTADGDLDFAVVVAGERLDPMVLVARREHTLDFKVDPARRYCFQVRATDGRSVFTSDPVPIRGARCTQ